MEREALQRGGGGTNRLPDKETLKNENNKNMKLFGRGLRTEATQDVSKKSIIGHAWFTPVQIAMETMTNHRPVTKI